MIQKIRMDIVPGHNIRRIRIAQSRRQWEIALQLQLMGCDLSRGDYAKIEAGQRNISIQELRCIREVLNTTYDEILEGDSPESSAGQSPAPPKPESHSSQ